MTRYILRGCPRCGGDLYVDDQYLRKDDWLCLQCGHYRHRPLPQPPAGYFRARGLLRSAVGAPDRPGGAG